MKRESEIFTNATADQLEQLFRSSDLILIKKLSNNDRDWAEKASKHQAGVYIPHEQRDGGFFPPLQKKLRDSDGADEIREVYFSTTWSQLGNEEKRTRLVHYTSKGQETHMTGLPKPVFAGLLPASYLVMGRFKSDAYACITVDSGSEEALFLRDLFNIGPDFLIGEFAPQKIKTAEIEHVLDFTEQIINAWQSGQIALFAKENAEMPVTTELAGMAQKKFLTDKNLKNLDPFVLDTPGDVLREISRNIEWELFREYQRKERSVALVRTVVGDEPRRLDAKDIIRALIDQFSNIDALMLSASQQRKSRAGYSYEHHIEKMLSDGKVPFEKQVIIESQKRPDFILPSLAVLNVTEGRNSGLILSAKTTLRERWKQVEREKKGRRLFLTTVDENIAGNAIEDMASIGIRLVIPESLMKSKETEYAGHTNVITFKQFCETELKPNLSRWGVMGLY